MIDCVFRFERQSNVGSHSSQRKQAAVGTVAFEILILFPLKILNVASVSEISAV